MLEPAEKLLNTSTALARESDRSSKRENLKLVGSEKGLKFFNGRCIVHVANRAVRRQKAYELLYNLYAKKGPERNFTKVNGAPSVLLNGPLTVYNRLKHTQRIFPFFMINYSDQMEIEIAKIIETMVRPMSNEEFYTFFIDKTDTWQNASPHQKEFIKKAYPAHEINHNEVSRALARGFSKKNRYAEDTLKDIQKTVCK